jgi:AraC-like DNA-binding protein
VNYIIIVGATQALMALGILLKDKKNNGQHDNILSYLLASIFLHLAISFALNVFWPNSKIHQQFNTFIALAYPGLLWCYTRYLEDKGKPIDILLAMFPSIGASLGYFWVAAYVITHSGELPTFIKLYNSISGYAYTVLYLVYPLKILAKTHTIPAFWKLEKRMARLAASLFLFVGFAFLVISIWTRIFDISTYFDFIHLWLRLIIYSILAVICISIIYVKVNSFLYVHLHQQKQIKLRVLDLQHEDRLDSSTDKSQYPSVEENEKNAGIDYVSILAKVENLMSQHKVFLDSSLTLEILAAKADVSRHHLSETLNQYREKSFYQYINEYRIKEVVTLMDLYKSKGKNINILAMAFQAGFHSKSSFNQYFKKVQGCTPSAYLKAKPQYNLVNT